MEKKMFTITLDSRELTDVLYATRPKAFDKESPSMVERMMSVHNKLKRILNPYAQ